MTVAAALLLLLHHSSRACAPITRSTGGLGGQVQAVALLLGAAAGQPGATNQPVTISFTTQTALTLAANGRITITWPPSYLQPTGSATSFGVVYSGPAATFAATASGSTNGAVLVVGSAGAPAGAYTVTLNGATIGTQRSSPVCNGFDQANCIFVTTSVITGGTTYTADNRGYSRYPPILPKGQVQGVSLTILDQDRFPGTGTDTKVVTVTFTTQTDLNAGTSDNVIM